MKLFVSFPKPPDAYPRDGGWHAQVSSKLYWGLKQKTVWNIEFIGWNQEVDLATGEYLLTFLPNRNYVRTNKIFGIENDTLRQSRWVNSEIELFGAKYRIDDLRPYAPMTRGKAGAYVMTNDVALRRWAEGQSDTVRRVERWRNDVEGNVEFGPHPIDKSKFKPIIGPLNRRNLRMLVLHRGWRKTLKNSCGNQRACGGGNATA